MTSRDTEDIIWTTLDGRKIPVGELERDHAQQIIRLLLRREQRRRAKLRKILDDLERATFQVRLRQVIMEDPDFTNGPFEHIYMDR